MNATSQSCRIVVNTGPDRGKVFDVEEELVHIGRADENHIVLDDPSLPDHQASVLRKNGRFAIFRPTDSEVQVDGADIPVEKWVWLPTDVQLQFGRRTRCQLTYELPLGEQPSGAAADAGSEGSSQTRSLPSIKPVSPVGNPDTRSPTEGESADQSEDASDESAEASSGPARKKSERRRKSKSAKRRKNVARFITDKGGPRVELGADGHLPELALEDDPTRKEKKDRPKQSNSTLLYCVLGLSLVSSFAMLLADVDPPSVSEMSRAEARNKIIEFFGSDEKDLEPWQKALRAARLANSRGDYQAELSEYRKVLRVLNSEDRDPHIGVTGHLTTDDELRRLIGIIISR